MIVGTRQDRNLDNSSQFWFSVKLRKVASFLRLPYVSLFHELNSRDTQIMLRESAQYSGLMELFKLKAVFGRVWQI